MRLIKYTIVSILSMAVSYLVIEYLAYPTLSSYPRLSNTMARFPYTKFALILSLSICLWLAYIQWDLKKVSVIYLYLASTVYLFLLFVVLFTKAKSYHDISLDVFDFIKPDQRDIREAILNVIYFMPLGAIYGFKANKYEFVVIALMTILGVETIQYAFYLGIFALSDILLNFIGSAAGFTLCKILSKRLEIESL